MTITNAISYTSRKSLTVAAAILTLCAAGPAQRVEGEKSYTFEQVRGHELAKGGVSLEIHAMAGRIVSDGGVTVSRPAGGLADPMHIGASGGLDVDVWIFRQRASVLSVEALAESRDAYREQGTEEIPVYRTSYQTVKRIVWQGLLPTIQYVRVPTGIYLAGYRSQPYDRVVEAHRGAKLDVTLFGQTIVDKSWEPTTFSKKYEFGPLSLMKQPLRATFTVGPVPITVSANAGLQAEIELRAQVDPIGARATASLPSSAWVYGWAAAGIGGSVAGIGADAGVRADLQLMKTTLMPELTASLAGLRGDMTLALDPLTASMSLYASVHYLVGSSTWKLPLFEFSLPNVTWARQVF